MDEISTEKFVDLLVTAHTNEKNQEGDATKAILKYRTLNPVHFLINCLNITKVEGVQQIIIQLAFLLATSIFPRDFEDDSILPEIPSDLVSELLSFSLSQMGGENISFATQFAGFYSRLMAGDIKYDLGYNSLNNLRDLFCTDEITNINLFKTIGYALSEVFSYISINDDVLEPILFTILNQIHNENNEVKLTCIQCLKNIAEDIESIVTDENSQDIIDSIQHTVQLLQVPEIKRDIYELWAELLSNYYPIIEGVVLDIAQLSFRDFCSENPDDVMGACIFWDALCECECDDNAIYVVIGQCAEQLLSLACHVVFSAPTNSIPNDTEYEPWTLATQIIQRSVIAAPVECFPVLVRLASSTMNSNRDSERVASLIILGSLIEASNNDTRNINSFFVESVDYILESLDDECPRVRYYAVLCVHTLLINILENGDECPYIDFLLQIREHIELLSKVILRLMISDDATAYVATLTAVDFIRFPGFPDVSSALTNMYKNAISSNVFLSNAAFSGLSSAVENVDPKILNGVLNQTLKLLETVLSGEVDNFYIREICGLLQLLFVKLSGYIDEYVEVSFQLLAKCLHLSTENIEYAILPLASLASGTSVTVFSPYLDDVLTIIMDGMDYSSNDSNVQSNCCFAFSLITEKYDLGNNAGDVIKVICNFILNENVELSPKKCGIETLKNICIKNPQSFAEHYEKIVETLSFYTEYVNGASEEFDENQKDDLMYEAFVSILDTLFRAYEEYLKVFSQFVPHMVDCVLNEYFDVLETAFGMPYHKDDLLNSIALCLDYLITYFPDPSTDFLVVMPTFPSIIKMMADSGVQPEITAKIKGIIESSGMISLPVEEANEE